MNYNKMLLTDDELSLIKTDMQDKISKTERELEVKEHPASVIEVVNEQLERRRKILYYIKATLKED